MLVSFASLRKQGFDLFDGLADSFRQLDLCRVRYKAYRRETR